MTEHEGHNIVPTDRPPTQPATSDSVPEYSIPTNKPTRKIVNVDLVATASAPKCSANVGRLDA